MPAVAKQTAALPTEQSLKRIASGKSLGGPPCKYSHDEIIQVVADYIDNYEQHDDKIPSIQGLAVALNVSRSTIYKWIEDGNKELSDMLSKLMAQQGRITLNNGLDGTFNPTICKLVLSKHGYHDNADKSGTSVNVTINRGSVQVETGGQIIDVDTD